MAFDFLLPFGIIDRLYLYVVDFSWNSKHPPIARSFLCRPKDLGGVGLSDFRIWNKALLVKILWDIHSKIDSLWVKSIHHDYLYRVDVWNWKPHTLYTPLIKKFLAIRDEIELRIGSIHTIISLLSKLYPSLDLIKPILFSALQFLCLFCRVSLG